MVNPNGRRRGNRRGRGRAAGPSRQMLKLEHTGRKLRLSGDPPSVTYNQWNPLVLIGAANVAGTAAPINLASSDVLTGIQAQIGFTATGTLQFRLLQSRVYRETTNTTFGEEIRVLMYDPDNSDVVLTDLYDLSNAVNLAGVGFVYPKSRSAQPFTATDVLTIASSASTTYKVYLHLLWRITSTVAPASSLVSTPFGWMSKNITDSDCSGLIDVLEEAHKAWNV